MSFQKRRALLDKDHDWDNASPSSELSDSSSDSSDSDSADDESGQSQGLVPISDDQLKLLQQAVSLTAFETQSRILLARRESSLNALELWSSPNE